MMRWILLILPLYLLEGCGGNADSSTQPIDSSSEIECPECIAEQLHFTSHESPFIAGVGEKIQLQVFADCLSEDTNKSIVKDLTFCSNYRSLDSSIATVDNSGMLLAMREGFTSIEAEYHNITADIDVKVVPPYVKSLKITPEHKTINQGESYTVSAKGISTNGKEVPVNGVFWKVDDPSCVSIFSWNGEVTAALKPCDAIITGTFTNQIGNKVKGTSSVRVTLQMKPPS